VLLVLESSKQKISLGIIDKDCFYLNEAFIIVTERQEEYVTLIIKKNL
jgi:hypothetical protein